MGQSLTWWAADAWAVIQVVVGQLCFKRCCTAREHTMAAHHDFFRVLHTKREQERAHHDCFRVVHIHRKREHTMTVSGCCTEGGGGNHDCITCSVASQRCGGI
jgi:hypothetical protein